MNWFERYGIPGLYFVLLVTILCCVIFGLPYCKNQRDIAIKAFVATLPASVPIGYILVIFSQMLVYCDKIPWWEFTVRRGRRQGRRQRTTRIKNGGLKQKLQSVADGSAPIKIIKSRKGNGCRSGLPKDSTCWRLTQLSFLRLSLDGA